MHRRAPFYGWKSTRVNLLIGGLQHHGGLLQVDSHRSQPDRIEEHLDLALAPPDNGGDRNIGLALDDGLHLGGHPTQHVVVAFIGPEGQRKDGHIIDIARFDQRRAGSPGDAVIVGHQLGLQPDDGLFFILPHVEPYHGHGHAGSRSGVDVFHAGNLPEQFFHGTGDALLHLLARAPGI
jgi:hypothetical protein